MKKWNYFFSMTLAALAFTACSSNDDPTAETTEEGNSYMTVRLMMPDGSLATKATTDGGYVNGSSDENKITAANTHFYFYDQYGVYLTQGSLSEVGTGSTGTSGNNVEWSSSNLVVLGPTPSKPTQMLTVINVPESVHTAMVGKSLNEAKAYIYSEALASAAGSFVMTTSVYNDGTKDVYTTAIDNDKYYDTSAAATGATNPVEIYVERLVAKVNVTKGSDIDEESSNYFSKKLDGRYVLDGAEKDVRIAIDGWKINAINNNSYLVKNIDGLSAAAPFTSWNNAADFRCFWAKDANYSGNGAYDFTKNASDQADTYKDVEYFSWVEAAKNGYAASTYLYENTAAKDNQQIKPNSAVSTKANVPTLLVAAHIQMRNASTATTTTDFANCGTVYRRGGVFYTEAGLKELIANALSDYRWKETSGTGTALVAAADLTVDLTTFSKDNKATLTPNVTAITKSGYNLQDLTGAAKTITDVQATISTAVTSGMLKDIICYTNGDCYYQVPIEHLTSTDANQFCGVVRNHVYQLTIDGVSAIGGAVSDPGSDPSVHPGGGTTTTPGEDLVVIPGEEKNYYISAKLNILSWKVVNQSITLK